MIKIILVPTSGTDADDSVLATALAVARPLNAHLDCFHLRFSLGEAVARSPHVQYCVGSSLGGALLTLEERDEQRANSASAHFESFCSSNHVAIRAAAVDSEEVSAQHLVETDEAEERLVYHARHRDLTVLGRPHTRNLLAPNLIERLLMDSGRPIVIAPDSGRTTATGNIVVGWKETPEAARALGAAMPLLRQARRVILVGVAEKAYRPEALAHLAQMLRWHRIEAETRFIERKSKKGSTARHLLDAVAEVDADWLIVGGYGHGPLREAFFGGVTQSLIEHAAAPIFLMN